MLARPGARSDSEGTASPSFVTAKTFMGCFTCCRLNAPRLRVWISGWFFTSSKTLPEIRIPPGTDMLWMREATLTPSPNTPSSSCTTSPVWIPMRRGTWVPLRSAAWISMALRTAEIALLKTESEPSP